MKVVRFFNPLHILGNKVSVSDIDGLKISKLYEHPEIVLRKDTFDLSDCWKTNFATLPGFTYIQLSIQSQFNNCHLLQSRILSVSLITVKVIDYHFHFSK